MEHTKLMPHKIDKNRNIEKSRTYKLITPNKTFTFFHFEHIFTNMNTNIKRKRNNKEDS